MPGHIGTNKHLQRKVFRELCPPGTMPVRNDNGGYTFVPWKRQSPTPTRTRDAAQSNTHTIAEHIASRFTIADVVAAMTAIDQRMSALEAKRAQQRQLLEQQQQPDSRRQQQPLRQPLQPVMQPTHDHAGPCACQHHQPPAPQAPHRGVATMDTSSRHPGLAPNRFITDLSRPSFDVLVRRATHDQRYGETPSRFDSVEQDRLSRHAPGAAGPPTQRELNDAYAAHWARDAGAPPLGASGVNVRGNMVEAVSSDPSEAFLGPGGPFVQFRNDDVRPSPAALSELNRQYSKAKTPQARDAITDAWKSYMTAPCDAASMAAQWKPRQPMIPPRGPNADNTKDAPWSNLYSQNASVIGSDPNKISPGMKLDVGGGQTHEVQAGETLSGIARQYGGGSDLGSRSLASETGGVSPTTSAGPAGSYSSGGDLTSGEGAPAGAPGSHNAANVPTPPVKPDLGSSGGESSGWANPAKMDYSVSNTGSSGPDVSKGVPTPPSCPSDLGSSGGEGGSSGIHPLASEGGSGLSQSGGSSDYEDAKKPRGPRGRK